MRGRQILYPIIGRDSNRAAYLQPFTGQLMKAGSS